MRRFTYASDSPRRKVVGIKRLYYQDYKLQFTLECGHVEVRSRHKECASMACLQCRLERRQKEQVAE